MSYQNAEFSRDGKGLYVTLDAGSEFQRLASMDLATKKTEFLTPDTADVDDFDLSEDGARIAYVTNEKGVSVVRLLDTATRRELPGPKLPLGRRRAASAGTRTAARSPSRWARLAPTPTPTPGT